MNSICRHLFTSTRTAKTKFLNVMPNIINKQLKQSIHSYSDADLTNNIFNTETDNKRPKIVIIGAGVAGLTAANHLLHNNFINIDILEASDRYGGRIQTLHFGDATCELGAKWVHKNNLNKSFYELVQNEDNIETFTDFTKRYFVTSQGHKLNPNTVEKVTESFHDILKNFNAHNDSFFLHSSKIYLEMLTEKICKNIFKKNSQEAAQIFHTLIKDLCSMLGCDLSQVHISQLAKMSPIYSNLISIQTGLLNVLNPVVNIIKKDCLHFGKGVETIYWSMDNPNQRIKIKCIDKTVFNADHLICTIPLGTMKMFNSILFNPMLPIEKNVGFDCLGVSTPGKYYLNYKDKINNWFIGNMKPTWTSEELNNRQNICQDISEISTITNSNHVLEIKRIGDEDFERIPDTIIIEQTTKLLRNLMQNSNIPYPNDIIRSNWATNTNFLGGLPYLTKSDSEYFINCISKPVGPKNYHQNSIIPRLLFAGDATDWDGFGTLDGARRSGIREAQRLIDYYKIEEF